MFFKLSVNTAFIQTHTEGSVWVVHYVLSVLITDYKFKQQKLTFIMVVKFCCELQLHLKLKFLFLFLEKCHLWRRKLEIKYHENTTSAIN